MNSRLLFRLSLTLLLAVTCWGLTRASATANLVVPSRLSRSNMNIIVNDLRPPECAGLNLTSLVTGSGTIDGTSSNDLILGSGGADTLSGGGGSDCLVGGGGNDTINGSGSKGDVCIGGPGTDTFKKCETEIQ